MGGEATIERLVTMDAGCVSAGEGRGKGGRARTSFHEVISDPLD